MKKYHNERWKRIKGYSNYEISNYGRTKSFWYKKPKILKQHKNHGGYYLTGLKRTTPGSKMKTFIVHLLVWDNFGDKQRGLGLEVHHINGNRGDNRIDNLELLTRQQHAFKTVAANSDLPPGVRKKKTDDMYQAVIRINKKRVNLGRYHTAKAAGRAVRMAMKAVEEEELSVGHRTPSGRRRRGRNAFEPDLRPEELNPYLPIENFYDQIHSDDWMNGWNEAKANHIRRTIEEEEKKNDRF